MKNRLIESTDMVRFAERFKEYIANKFSEFEKVVENKIATALNTAKSYADTVSTNAKNAAISTSNAYSDSVGSKSTTDSKAYADSVGESTRKLSYKDTHTYVRESVYFNLYTELTFTNGVCETRVDVSQFQHRTHAVGSIYPMFIVTGIETRDTFICSLVDAIDWSSMLIIIRCTSDTSLNAKKKVSIMAMNWPDTISE